MAWYDSIGDGWLNSNDSSWWSSVGDSWLDSGDSFDWGSVWDTAGDWFGSSGGGDSGGSSGWLNTLGNLFGGGGDSSGSGGWADNIFTAMLGGLAGGADAKLGIEMVKQKAAMEGAEERKTLGFAAELEDFYKQQDKSRKRAALDTYGQFSLMDRWAPNAQPAPAVQVPTKPQAGQGGY